MKKSEAEAYRTSVEQGELAQAAGGMKTEIVQSDKLGYDWKVYYCNDVVVRRDYIPQDIVRGNAENPIEWAGELKLYRNFYYIHEGVRKVWFGGQGVTASWDDPDFVEF